jgi:hypothetical protein
MIPVTLVNDKKHGTTMITSITPHYMSPSLELAWRIIRYSWARFIGRCHNCHTDGDDLRSGSFLPYNDYGSKFRLLRVWFCFKSLKLCLAVHGLVYKYEFTMFNSLRLHLVSSCSKFSVLCLLSHKGVNQVLHFGFPIIDW